MKQITISTAYSNPVNQSTILTNLNPQGDLNNSPIPQLIASNESKTPWPPQFLRERVETAANLKKEIDSHGFNNEAAMDLGTFIKLISIGSTVFNILNKLGVFDPSGKAKNLEEVGLYMDTLYTNDFNSNDFRTKLKAIEAVKNAPLKNPQEITWKFERAFRDLILITDKTISDTQRKSLEKATEAVLLILQGLYQRDDIGSCSLELSKNSYHGWQYNSSNSQTKGEDLSKEQSWYGYNNACELFTDIAKQTHIYSEESKSKWGKKGPYSPIFPITKNLSRILVSNWNVPVQYKFPSPDTPPEFREYMHRNIINYIENEQEGNYSPLYLTAPEGEIPIDLRTKVSEFKFALISAIEKIPSSDQPYNKVPILELAVRVLDTERREKLLANVNNLDECMKYGLKEVITKVANLKKK